MTGLVLALALAAGQPQADEPRILDSAARLAAEVQLQQSVQRGGRRAIQRIPRAVKIAMVVAGAAVFYVVFLRHTCRAGSLPYENVPPGKASDLDRSVTANAEKVLQCDTRCSEFGLSASLGGEAEDLQQDVDIDGGDVAEDGARHWTVGATVDDLAAKAKQPADEESLCRLIDREAVALSQMFVDGRYVGGVRHRQRFQCNPIS